MNGCMMTVLRKRRGSVLLSRGMPVRSQELKITGVCDMVELYKDDGGVPIQGRMDDGDYIR